MGQKKYRLNVDFDNTIIPFLYNDTGEFTFTVPSSPNFMDTRYLVYLPCVMVLSDPTKIPAISGYTRIEGAIPDSDEFRTIAADNYETMLLKDAIEFNASEAGKTLTITNLYTIGSTVSPDAGALYNDDRRGFPIYTSKSSGVNSDINLGILYRGQGVCYVDGVECLAESADIIPITSDLTNGYWYIIYLDNAGTFSLEQTTDTDYTSFPIAQLESKAPINSKKIARYKSGDLTKRAVAIAYSLPAQSTYAAGTTYSRRAMVEYSGSVYVSIADSNTGNTPSSSPTYWLLMGNALRIFCPEVHNIPIETFGTGELGDVTLDGTGLGATATPFYGIEEETASTPEYYPEYNFNNLTLSGICYCGKNNGNSLSPVIIRVKGTLTIESGGQLNGDERGASGGAGASAVTSGGAGGAGAKSGRPIYIYANRIINKRTSGYWVTCKAGNGSEGGAGSVFSSTCVGGSGGGGAGSSSNLTIITNSGKNEISGYNQNLAGKPGNGGACSSVLYYGAGGGAGGGYGKQNEGCVAHGGRVSVSASGDKILGYGGDGGATGCNGLMGFPNGNSEPGHGGYAGTLGGGGGGGGGAGASSNGGNGGNGIAGGGGGGTCVGSALYNGGNGSTALAGGGGGGAGSAANGNSGNAPAIPHTNLGNLIVIANYSTRFGV